MTLVATANPLTISWNTLQYAKATSICKNAIGKMKTTRKMQTKIIIRQAFFSNHSKIKNYNYY